MDKVKTEIKIINLVDLVYIPLLKINNIGICVSGGADSAILLYILMKNICHSQKLFIFSCYSNEKGRSNAQTVPEIIELCIQLTGFTNIEHHGQYVASQNIENLFEPIRKHLNSGLISQAFSAVTANPPHEELILFQGINDDSKNRISTKIRSTKDADLEIYTPFTNINKKFIAMLYRLYGREEDLFPKTRSCEAICNIPTKSHCGECWWCEERRWAFDKL